MLKNPYVIFAEHNHPNDPRFKVGTFEQLTTYIYANELGNNVIHDVL